MLMRSTICNFTAMAFYDRKTQETPAFQKDALFRKRLIAGTSSLSTTHGATGKPLLGEAERSRHSGMMCRPEHLRVASALAHQAMQALQWSGE